jgi:hypothetical protein
MKESNLKGIFLTIYFEHLMMARINIGYIRI